jgi:hypothetical protein
VKKLKKDYKKREKIVQKIWNEIDEFSLRERNKILDLLLKRHREELEEELKRFP